MLFKISLFKTKQCICLGHTRQTMQCIFPDTDPLYGCHMS